MTRFSTPALCRVAVVALALGGFALPRVARAADDEKKQKTELNKQMEEMDTLMKKLKVSIRKAEGDKLSLEYITKIQALTVSSKQQIPSKAAGVPEDQRQKFVTEYRKQMASLLSDMCSMETALLDGNRAKAQEIYKKLKTDEETGHDQFMPDDDKAKSEK